MPFRVYFTFRAHFCCCFRPNSRIPCCMKTRFQAAHGSGHSQWMSPPSPVCTRASSRATLYFCRRRPFFSRSVCFCASVRKLSAVCDDVQQDPHLRLNKRCRGLACSRDFASMRLRAGSTKWLPGPPSFVAVSVPTSSCMVLHTLGPVCAPISATTSLGHLVKWSHAGQAVLCRTCSSIHLISSELMMWAGRIPVNVKLARRRKAQRSTGSTTAQNGTKSDGRFQRPSESWSKSKNLKEGMEVAKRYC